MKSPIALDWMSQSRFLSTHSRTVFASNEGTNEGTNGRRPTRHPKSPPRSVEPLSPFFLFFLVFPPLSVRPSRCGLRKCQLRAIAALRVEQGGAHVLFLHCRFCNFCSLLCRSAALCSLHSCSSSSSSSSWAFHAAQLPSCLSASVLLTRELAHHSPSFDEFREIVHTK